GTRALVRASVSAARMTAGSLPSPSCARPCQKAEAKRDGAERVSQLRVGCHDRNARRRSERTCPASIAERQNERRFSSSQAAGELAQLPEIFRASRTCGVS